MNIVNLKVFLSPGLLLTSLVKLALILMATRLVSGAAAEPLNGTGPGNVSTIQAKFKDAQDAMAAGDLPKALESISSALSLAEAGGYSQLAGNAYGWRSQIRYQQGDLPLAISDLQGAAKALEMAGIHDQAIGALNEKAVLEERLGEMGSAELSLVSARKLASDHGLKDEGTVLACELVRFYMRLGRGDAAKMALADAESSSTTNEKIKGKILMSRARYSSTFEDKGEGLAAFEEAVPILLRTGDFHEAANAQYNSAVSLGEMKRFDEADKLLDESVANFTRTGSLAATGMAWSLKAWHLIERDRLDAAEPILRQADKMLRDTDFLPRLAENELRYAYYWKKRNDPIKARESAESAAAMFEKMGAADQAKSIRAAFPGE